VEKGPKKAKGISKKGKKGWRKNVDIEKVEEYLEDKRLEERLGGAFKDRPDADLFTIDKDAEETDRIDRPETDRKTWRKIRENKPLKCFQHLEIKTGVADPIKKRNRRKTPAERRNLSIRDEKEKALIQSGVVKAKTKLQKKHRELESLKKSASELERTTRRRTEFDFDLWTDPEVKAAKEINDNEWLSLNAKNQSLKIGHLQKINPPEDLLELRSDLKAVEIPHSGSSYNPSLKDHQDLLWKAAIVEINKDKAEHKIEYHTTKMFSKLDQATIKKNWIEEMSEGVPKLDKSMAEETEENVVIEEEEDEDEEAKMFKPKNKKQKNREKREKYEENLKKAEDEEKKKFQDVFKLRSMRKEMTLGDQKSALRSKIKEVKKLEKRSLPAVLSGVKYEEGEIPLKLGEELTGNLRTLKPEGNLLEDRFKSMQARNIFETRTKPKCPKAKRIKKVEKRSYKMGFAFEKTGLDKKGKNKMRN